MPGPGWTDAHGDSIAGVVRGVDSETDSHPDASRYAHAYQPTDTGACVQASGHAGAAYPYSDIHICAYFYSDIHICTYSHPHTCTSTAEYGHPYGHPYADPYADSYADSYAGLQCAGPHRLLL